MDRTVYNTGPLPDGRWPGEQLLSFEPNAGPSKDQESIKSNVPGGKGGHGGGHGIDVFGSAGRGMNSAASFNTKGAGGGNGFRGWVGLGGASALGERPGRDGGDRLGGGTALAAAAGPKKRLRSDEAQSRMEGMKENGENMMLRRKDNEAGPTMGFMVNPLHKSRPDRGSSSALRSRPILITEAAASGVAGQPFAGINRRFYASNRAAPLIGDGIQGSFVSHGQGRGLKPGQTNGGMENSGIPQSMVPAVIHLFFGPEDHAKVFTVDKNYLVDHIPFFRRMFPPKAIGSMSGQFRFNNDSGETFQLILDWLETGQIPEYKWTTSPTDGKLLTESYHILGLHRLADMICMRNLCDIAVSAYIAGINAVGAIPRVQALERTWKAEGEFSKIRWVVIHLLFYMLNDKIRCEGVGKEPYPIKEAFGFLYNDPEALEVFLNLTWGRALAATGTQIMRPKSWDDCMFHHHEDGLCPVKQAVQA